MREILQASPVPHHALAREAGLSYATLHSWIVGTREATPESREKIAAAFERLSASMLQLARDARAG